MLISFNIKMLVDIRSLTRSRKFPHFNKEILEPLLDEAGIHYLHMFELGGRRKVKKDAKITVGAMILSKDTLTIWKQMILKMQLWYLKK
jgi:uncharacterized protein (DUF488 family)